VTGANFLLANYFLASYCREMKREPMSLAPEAVSACIAYAWPGNVRELENEMKRLVLSVFGSTVQREDLSEAICGTRAEPLSRSEPGSLKDVVSDLEKRMIEDALKQFNQNQRHAAKALGLSRHGLIKKMKRYNITRSDGLIKDQRN
jgi:Nif-specific regulatory protein